MKTQNIMLPLGLFLSMLLLGCTQTSMELSSDTEAFIEDEKPKTLYVKLGKQQLPFTNDPKYVLGQQIRWVSKGKEVIYTEHGRLVKTENFSGGNLLFSYANQKDPLELNLLKKENRKTYKRLVDWTKDQMGVSLNSTFLFVSKESVRIPKKTFSVDTLLFHEKVSVPTLSVSYINKYWIDEKTAKVIKTEQLFNPKQPPLVLIFSEK